MMDERRYDVLFSGELAAGVDRETAMARLAILFKTNQAGIGRLFRSDTIVIKKGLDEETAYRYREAMRQAGAVCHIRPSAPAPSAIGPANSLATATVLPPGSLLPQPPRVPPLEFDFAGLSVDPPGVQLIDQPPPKSARIPDTSGMTLGLPGDVLVVPTAVVAAPIPDTSRMSLAPAGSDLLPAGERPAIPPPPAAGAFELLPVELQSG